MDFPIRWKHAADEWTPDGRKITSPEHLEILQRTLDESPIVVEHWFYRGGSAPHRFVCDDYDDFIEYLQQKASAGDAIHVWNFSMVCRDDNAIASGKCPAEDGCVPRRGAY